MPKILLADDDVNLMAMVEHSLKFDHYQIETATDGEEALELLRNNSFDMAVLDLNMPVLTGVEVCTQYRAGGGTIPILMLTGQTAIEMRVTGLESGADDYLTKPFAMPELHARIRALLRRADRQLAQNSLTLGPISIDPETFRVTVHDQDVALVRKEFFILELLVRYPGRVFSAEDIINKVWKSDETPTGDVVRSHIRNIRKKLGDDNVIQTVHGIGYKAEWN